MNTNLAPNDLATPLLLLLLAAWCALFDVVNASQSYLYLRPVGNLGWAFIFGGIGALKTAAILFDYCKCRLVLIAICIALWLTICGFIIAANYASPATPACIYFAYQNVLSWLRVRSHLALCPN